MILNKLPQAKSSLGKVSLRREFEHMVGRLPNHDYEADAKTWLDEVAPLEEKSKKKSKPKPKP